MPAPPPTAALRALALALVAAAGATVGPAAARPEDPAPAAPAVRAYLHDGRRAEGILAALGPAGIEVRPASGAPFRAPLAEVLELDFDLPPAEAPRGGPAAPRPGKGAPPPVIVDLAGGDRLEGVLARGSGESGFVVEAPGLGAVEAPLERVRSARFPSSKPAAADAIPLRVDGREDLFLFRSGDRLEGALRLVEPHALTVRVAGGTARTLPVESLAGFALAPLPAPPEKGVRARLHLRSGSRVSGATVTLEGGSLVLAGMADGRERRVPAPEVEAVAFRGGEGGACLGDLAPPRVEIVPYWGDDPPVLAHAPVFDRAFHLEPAPPPPLRVGGRGFARGISVFSGTTLHFDLEGRGFRRFHAAVAVDDAGPKGAVEFEVLVDGKSAWKSGVVRAAVPGAAPLPVPTIPVEGAKTLSLRVHAGPGDEVHDFADWLVPSLTR